MIILVSTIALLVLGFVYHKYQVNKLNELLKDKDAKYHSMVDYIKTLSAAAQTKPTKSKQAKDQK